MFYQYPEGNHKDILKGHDDRKYVQLNTQQVFFSFFLGNANTSNMIMLCSLTSIQNMHFTFQLKPELMIQSVCVGVRMCMLKMLHSD